MKYLTRPFITLGGIEVPIDEEARRQFGRLKLKELNVVPFEKVGKTSWNVITYSPYDYKIRERFLLATNQRIHIVHFVSPEEFKRVLENYF